MRESVLFDVAATGLSVPGSHPNFYWVRAGLSAVYGLAALSKGVELIDASMLMSTTGRVVLALQVGLEGVFAVWLVAGFLHGLTWRICVATSALFLAISGFKAGVGETSCGCFGALPITPWHSIALNLTILSLLCGFRPNAGDGRPTLGRHVATSALVLIALPIAAYTSSQYPVLLGGLAPAAPILLNPSEWADRRFPLIPEIDVGAQLERAQPVQHA